MIAAPAAAILTDLKGLETGTRRVIIERPMVPKLSLPPVELGDQPLSVPPALFRDGLLFELPVCEQSADDVAGGEDQAGGEPGDDRPHRPCHWQILLSGCDPAGGGCFQSSAPISAAPAAPHTDRLLTKIKRGLQTFGPDCARPAVGPEPVPAALPGRSGTSRD